MPPSREEYEQTLTKLKGMLKRNPMTAQEIAKALNCGKPIAYKRLQALKERGVTLFELPSPRPSKTGPKPIAFGIR